ncbi:MAG: ankyrin repeat domain-containing protein [Sphaerochaetaceae bacterium]|nr:ankyrin repeat domain-containing protein [Sphaerochaetaceae bacterium]
MTNKKKTLNKKLLAAAVSATKAKDIHDLIKQGADVNCTNEWGMSPVMLAAQYNTHVVVLKALVKDGADINAVEPKYRSNALHLAANTCSNPKIIEALVEMGADINVRNYLGETPLIMSVQANENTRIFSQLIDCGADYSICDWQGHSVMEYARREKRAYIITVLKKLGL